MQSSYWVLFYQWREKATGIPLDGHHYNRDCDSDHDYTPPRSSGDSHSSCADDHSASKDYYHDSHDDYTHDFDDFDDDF